MLSDGQISEIESAKIKNSQLFGIEYQPDIYALAISNMVIHGDGKTNIQRGDCFKESYGVREKHRPNVGLLNPPYKTKGSTTEELEFVLDNLRALEIGGTCVAITPLGCAIAVDATSVRLKTQILKKHTLEAVMSMPIDLFHDSKVNVVTCIMIITAHKPHPSGKETWFGYWRDDGFKITKHKGRIDVHGRWNKTMDKWVKSYRNRDTVNGLSVASVVGPKDEWCAEAFMETDYTSVTVADFEDEIKKYVAYRILNERHS